MKEYYWIKLRHIGKQEFVIASKEKDSNYFTIIETGKVHYQDSINEKHIIKQPLIKIQKTISKNEVDKIINHLKIKGKIDNYNGSWHGIVYAMSWYVKKYAKDYGIEESSIEPMSMYYLGDGSWDNKPKLVSEEYIKSHITQYCNELISEHNKVSDEPLNILAIWSA